MAIDTYMHNTGLSIIHLLWVSYVTDFLQFSSIFVIALNVLTSFDFHSLCNSTKCHGPQGSFTDFLALSSIV
jgi:hypothetical protein